MDVFTSYFDEKEVRNLFCGVNMFAHATKVRPIIGYTDITDTDTDNRYRYPYRNDLII